MRLKHCSIFTNMLNHLGHFITPGKIEVSKRSTEAIEGLKEPSPATGSKSFLLFSNFFSSFEPSLARMEAPLHDKLCKYQPTTFIELDDTEPRISNRLRNDPCRPCIVTNETWGTVYRGHRLLRPTSTMTVNEGARGRAVTAVGILVESVEQIWAGLWDEGSVMPSSSW